MLCNGFLRVALHFIIDGSIDAQAVLIQIVGRSVAFTVLVQPAIEGIIGPEEGVYLIILCIGVRFALGFFRAHDAAQHITEIRTHAGGAVSLTGVQGDGQGLEGIAGLSGEIVHRAHTVQHYVAAAQGVLRIQGGIVARGLVHHPNQHRTLFR